MESVRDSSYGAKKIEPTDYYYFVYFVLFWLGVGNLFPWNAFITASAYYANRFCGTSFESEFENFFSITFTVSQTIGLALSIVYQDSISLRNKIIWPLLCYACIFAVTTILVIIQDIQHTLLFIVTLLSALMCGICGSILSSGIFGLGAMFPPAYTAALMNGQGLAGLFVSVSSIVTIVSTPPLDNICTDDDANNDDDCTQRISYSALAYFIIATLVLLSCIGVFLSLQNLPYARHFISLATEVSDSEKSITNPLMSPIGGNDTDRDSLNSVSAMARKNRRQGPPSANPDGIEKSYQEGTEDPVYYDEDIPNVEKTPLANIIAIYAKLRVPSLSVMFVFTVSIAVFPSLVVYIESVNKCNHSPNEDRFSNDLFVPFLFLMFNLCDFIGRLTAGMGASMALFDAKSIWIPAVARILFIPLFLMCNVSGSSLPTPFTHDACPIVIMILFAFSNGYVASTAMMLGASVAESHEAALAGTIMVFSLTVGLMCGAFFSFLVVYISQQG